MQFWIIEDDKKRGPFEDYDLREMIREGEISRGTKVWHPGADGWEPASDVPLLAGEFDLPDLLPPTLPIPTAPFLMWRRLGARWFDFLLYQLLLLIVFRIGGMPFIPDLESPAPASTIIGLLLPVIIMEGALVSSLGYTPGKWLMALRVTTREDKLLGTGAAIMRSLHVWVLGMGMRNGILLVFGHFINLWLVKKKGAPLWDLGGGYRVPGKDLSLQKILTFWILTACFFSIFLILIWPEFWVEFQPLLEAEMERQRK